ncbi:hypothetical protein VNO80_17377 [Phaseolus coccineus]|uniref:Uncharacterized protein n=1 Tax=Phaseolus coccineus TaxID=3886 RepID=A0AAN9MP97_PHACN
MNCFNWRRENLRRQWHAKLCDHGHKLSHLKGNSSSPSSLYQQKQNHFPLCLPLSLQKLHGRDSWGWFVSRLDLI